MLKERNYNLKRYIEKIYFFFTNNRLQYIDKNEQM